MSTDDHRCPTPPAFAGPAGEGSVFGESSTPSSFAISFAAGLLSTAHRLAGERGLSLAVGSILTADTFYDEPGSWQVWAKYGVLGIDRNIHYVNEGQRPVKILGSGEPIRELVG